MPVVREVDALHFVNKNESFFRGLIDNQAQLIKYYERQNKIEQIADYSQKFTTVLQTTLHKEISYEAPAAYWWQKGEFEKVLREPAIRQFIIDNREHPALVAWQEDHPQKDIPAPSQSEKEIKNLQELSTELQSRLQTASEELAHYINQLNGIHQPHQQTEIDINCLVNARTGISNLIALMSGAHANQIHNLQDRLNHDYQLAA